MRRNIWFATLLTILLGTNDATAARVDTKATDLDEARVSRRLSGTTSIYPISDNANQRFDLVNVGIRSNLDVGCGGLDLKDVLKTYYNADYQNIIDYIKANALGMAVNYLIYENPTLYSLLQDLKNSADFALNAQMISCQSIRESSDKKRKNNDYYADAKVLCLRDGNTETQCSDDGKLEKYLSQAIRNREDKMRTGAGGSGGGSSGPVAGGGNGGTPVSWNRYITSSMNLSSKDKDLVGRHTGDWKLQDGNVTSEPPSQSLSSDLDTLMKEYGERIGKIFDVAERDKRAFLPGNSSGVHADLKTLNLEEGVNPITIETIGKINAYPPNERSVAIGRLVRLVALGKLKAMVRREIMINLNGLQGPRAVDDAHVEEVKHVRQSINDLKLQLELIDEEFLALEKQSKYMAEVFDNSPNSKPVLR